VAAVASCALTVGVAVLLVKHKISTQRISTLVAQADVLASVGGAPGALGPGAHVYRVSGGNPVQLGLGRSSAVLSEIPTSGNAQGTVDLSGKSMLYVERQTPAGRVVLIRSAALAFKEWRPFLGSLILAGVGGVLLALVLSYLVARRLTRPIDELAAATRSLSAGESGVAVRVAGDDELAHLGATFNTMSEDLQRARESQRRFLESVSHELKTPLTSIRGYAEAVGDGAVPASEAGRVITAEADRLDRLVTDLLDLARFGRAGFSVAREPIDLAALTHQAVERHLPKARELDVQLSSGAASGAVALGDHDRLLQATSNLIENALRLTPRGGSVVVSARPGELSVRDTGPGLAPGDLPHAYERFYLYDRYRSERAVGTGLGLAIVKELTEAMGGTVQASNADGGGAEFTLRLQVPDARAAGREDAPDDTRDLLV
jgi:two-component system sensor histidine kinase BaeS